MSLWSKLKESSNTMKISFFFVVSDVTMVVFQVSNNCYFHHFPGECKDSWVSPFLWSIGGVLVCSGSAVIEKSILGDSDTSYVESP